MKILLSSSIKHFDPITKTVKIRHSVGVLVELFHKALQDMGEITYIGDNDHIQGEEFDLIISWPRNFAYLTQNNKFKKSVCFFNIAEASYLKSVLVPEAGRLGCKVSDCFTPENYYNADLNFLIGNDTVKQQYVDRGVDSNKIVQLYYRHGYIPFKERSKNKKPVFLHTATTLGLRKGFWHVVNDFKRAEIDAELWCVGQVQNERFWIDFVEETKADSRIKVFGWIPNSDPKYVELIHGSDFVVFPSFGEGQPGSVIEAMEGGSLPVTTAESGIAYNPFGWYKRGDTEIWKRLFNMTNEEFGVEQIKMKEYTDEHYDNQKFIDKVKQEITQLI